MVRSTMASILSDLARRLLDLGQRRPAQQLNLQAEMVAAGGDLDVAEAWRDAGRVYVAELEAAAGGGEAS
ncbi:MAG: hypothetical protein BGO94_14770 [Micrococcales bacterium 72-143]|nr:MAG: hypothetical protein BGO94_14770 [Micrococcales bacterium 72-143]